MCAFSAIQVFCDNGGCFELLPNKCLTCFSSGRRASDTASALVSEHRLKEEVDTDSDDEAQAVVDPYLEQARMSQLE